MALRVVVGETRRTFSRHHTLRMITSHRFINRTRTTVSLSNTLTRRLTNTASTRLRNQSNLNTFNNTLTGLSHHRMNRQRQLLSLSRRISRTILRRLRINSNNTRLLTLLNMIRDTLIRLTRRTRDLNTSNNSNLIRSLFSRNRATFQSRNLNQSQSILRVSFQHTITISHQVITHRSTQRTLISSRRTSTTNITLNTTHTNHSSRINNRQHTSRSNLITIRGPTQTILLNHHLRILPNMTNLQFNVNRNSNNQTTSGTLSSQNHTNMTQILRRTTTSRRNTRVKLSRRHLARLFRSSRVISNTTTRTTRLLTRQNTRGTRLLNRNLPMINTPANIQTSSLTTNIRIMLILRRTHSKITSRQLLFNRIRVRP